MKIKLHGFLAFLLLFVIALPGSKAQVWPGDVTNNGIVNHVDFLYWGNAFPVAGPPRDVLEMGIDWEAKELISEWGISFPGTGIDYAFADCDGDGIVSVLDIEAIRLNLGLTHGVVTPDEFNSGVAGVHPTVSFDTTNLLTPIFGTSTFLVPINLGNSEQVVEDFYGFGFKVRFDPEVIAAGGIFFSFDLPSWIDPSGNDLFEFVGENLEQGEISVAATRSFVNSPISGFGPIGAMFIIIEDDVVGFNQPSIESLIEIDEVILFGPNLDTQPVSGDTLTLTIFNDDLTLSQEIPAVEETLRVFPNPAQNEINVSLEGAQQLQAIRLVNAVGQIAINQTFSPRSSAQLLTSRLPDGVYILQIRIEDHWANRKVVLSRK